MFIKDIPADENNEIIGENIQIINENDENMQTEE